ncbi:hypothetical protein POM88_027010 [Heracleum sosnowskyi]|uniref:HD-Zip IV C-terminal domain-containing protein n=1 Tax=Heracleum sosnowskyi TaxID=360622 RepID=A0AAD8MP45_9APIA|nr:hypothetical protein POM88_027010 [Heracleum sosnowskyi]
MVLSFCTGVGASTAHTWTTISGSSADDVRVMTRKSIDDPAFSGAGQLATFLCPKLKYSMLLDGTSPVAEDIGHQILDLAHNKSKMEKKVKKSKSIFYYWCSLTVAQNKDVVEQFLLQNSSAGSLEVELEEKVNKKVQDKMMLLKVQESSR